MSVPGNTLDLFAGSADREAAVREVARDFGHEDAGFDRVHDFDEYHDHPRDVVVLSCACGFRREFGASTLYELCTPIVRRIVYERGGIPRELRHSQLAGEVCENPTFRGTERLKDATFKALEDRNPEAGIRAVAELLLPKSERPGTMSEMTS